VPSIGWARTVTILGQPLRVVIFGKCKGYVCVAGCSLQKAIDYRVKLKKHNYTKHRTTQAFDLDNTFTVFDGSGSFSDELGEHGLVPPITFQNSTLQSSLQQSSTVGMLDAIRRFVATTCFRSFTLPLDTTEGVPLPETIIVILMARLVFRIGTVNQALLSSWLFVFVLA
jgi:hypothetical protein